MYFEVRAHELFLANNRVLWTTHDPVAVVAVAVSSTTARQSRSRVSSAPACLRLRRAPAGAPGEARHGTVLKDTLVAGPYPYRGGDVDVTVRLYAAERDNKARTLLRTAERLTGAIADPGGVATFEKTTEAVVSAIESMFGLTPMRYLAGARLAARTGTLPFRSGYVAVIVPPAAPLETLRVCDDRLCHDTGAGSASVAGIRLRAVGRPRHGAARRREPSAVLPASQPCVPRRGRWRGELAASQGLPDSGLSGNGRQPRRHPGAGGTAVRRMAGDHPDPSGRGSRGRAISGRASHCPGRARRMPTRWTRRSRRSTRSTRSLADRSEARRQRHSRCRQGLAQTRSIRHE